MVVAHTFQDLFDASAKTTTLSLPPLKQGVLKLEFGSCKSNKTQFNGSEASLPFAESEVFHARIVNWRRLTADDKDCKSVYEVTFDIKSSNFTYKPGDTIGIIPRNNTSEVDFIINHLNLSTVADVQYNLCIENSEKSNKTKLPTHIPGSSTIRHVLTYCMDFRIVVKKLFLLALSRHTKDETERRVLEYLCSKEGTSAYTTYILNNNICLLDLLANFRSCKPSTDILFQHLPRLLPRPYSIVNSPLTDPHVVKICFSVMDIGNNRKGLTTGWIENIILNKKQSLENAFKNLSVTDNQSIPIYLRKNMNYFELPDTCNTPLILIGPGTGVAPYIGFLEQIEHLKTQESQKESCDVWLYFGSRHPKLDFIYKEELNGFKERKVLTCLKTAFSRYYDNYKNKYVQDAIMDNGEAIVKLIDDGSRIYVCGDLKTMAAQVNDAIVKCMVQYGGKSTEEAEKIIAELKKNKMYIVDIWN